MDGAGLGWAGNSAVYTNAMATKPPATVPWPPTRVRRVIRGLETSTGPLYVMTDAGLAFVKTLGNPEGPDALVSEWIGTRLAQWLGLTTFDVAVVEYPEELEFTLPKGCKTQAGPAFIARKVPGHVWDGSEAALANLVNPEAIAGLVVFDTWSRNYDRCAEGGGATRCNFRNVFFSYENAKKGRYRLLAMDHTECFRTGHALTDRSLFDLGAIQDERIYGLFPGFHDWVTRDRVRPFVDKLAIFRAQDFDACANGLPGAWGLRADTRDRLRTFCVGRAKFMVRAVENILERACGWHPVLPGTNLR